MESGDVKKLSLAGVLLAAAVVLFFALRQTDEAAPDSDDTKTHWFCQSCNRAFELTAAEMQSAVTQRTASSEGATSDAPRIRGRGAGELVSVAKCPHCGQTTGDAAVKCGGCGEVFAAKAKSGKPAICPKCQWDPFTGRKAEGDRLNAND